MEKTTHGKSALIVVALIFYIVAGVMFYKGYDKMANYKNSDYSSLNVNAYVGGDAYNYIINGTYATGFFVLGIGFLISGTVCGAASVLSNQMSDMAENQEKIADNGKKPERNSRAIDGDELPDL
jgi:hypothetical protein